VSVAEHAGEEEVSGVVVVAPVESDREVALDGRVAKSLHLVRQLEEGVDPGAELRSVDVHEILRLVPEHELPKLFIRGQWRQPRVRSSHPVLHAPRHEALDPVGRDGAELFGDSAYVFSLSGQVLQRPGFHSPMMCLPEPGRPSMDAEREHSDHVCDGDVIVAPANETTSIR